MSIQTFLRRGDVWLIQNDFLTFKSFMMGVRSLLYRNQPISLQSKSMDWFLYDEDIHRERVNDNFSITNVTCD